MAVTYCTVVQVVAQIGLVDENGARKVLTSSTIPSTEEVTELIEDVEDFIDNYCATSWRTITVTDERHSFSLNNNYWRNVNRGNGFYIQLNNKFIATMTAIELWQGSDYTDIVADEGDGQQDGDWFLEYEFGLLWINSQLPTFGEGSIKLSYTFGQVSAVPKTIRRASILLAAALLIESGFDYNNENIVNSYSLDNQEKAESWEKRAEKLLDTEIVPFPVPQR